jgi:hypothetical protein
MLVREILFFGYACVRTDFRPGLFMWCLHVASTKTGFFEEMPDIIADKALALCNCN